MFVLYSCAFFLYWSNRVTALSPTFADEIGLGGTLHGQVIALGAPGKRRKSNWQQTCKTIDRGQQKGYTIIARIIQI